MAIEIVSFPMKNGGSFHSKMLVYQRVAGWWQGDLIPWWCIFFRPRHGMMIAMGGLHQQLNQRFQGWRLRVPGSCCSIVAGEPRNCGGAGCCQLEPNRRLTSNYCYLQSSIGYL